MKVCTKCKIKKELEKFGIDKKSSDGTTSACRDCLSISDKLRRPKKEIANNPLIPLENEIWVEVNNHPNYLISNMGRIYSKRSFNGLSGKYMGFSISKGGYPCVSFKENGVAKMHKVHRLVAEHFIPNPDNLPYINHINSIKTDWSLSNLEWSDNRQNQSHSYKAKANSTSEYIGVHWCKKRLKWISQISVDNDTKYLGSFTDEEDAAQSYKDALVKYGLTNKYA